MESPLKGTTFREFSLWLCRRYRRLRITGDSMRPTLMPGQEVLIFPGAYATRRPEPGDIVVVDHPQQPGLKIIKRVLFVDAEGRCYLKGENATVSQDSRQFGLIPYAQLQGKVICRFP